MKKLLLMASLLSIVISQNYNPCNDSLYISLKQRDINELTDREYQYFVTKDKECFEITKNLQLAPSEIVNIEKETNENKRLSSTKDLDTKDEFYYDSKRTFPKYGYVMTLEPKSLSLSFSFDWMKADSYFDEDGDETSFKKSYENLADPIIKNTEFAFNILYPINQKLYIGVRIPVVLNQSVKFHPDASVSSYLLDVEGATGLGDISIESNYVFISREDLQFSFASSYYFKTGKDFEEVKDDELATGNDYNKISFFPSFDIRPNYSKTLLFSLGGRYALNFPVTRKDSMGSFKFKSGNYYNLFLGSTLAVNNNTSVSANIFKYWGNKNEIDGKESETDYKSEALTLSLNGQYFFKDNQYIVIGYNTNLSGIDIRKYSTFYISGGTIF